jgi:hypothetical protein
MALDARRAVEWRLRATCQARIADVLRMRLTLNRNAERLRACISVRLFRRRPCRRSRHSWPAATRRNVLAYRPDAAARRRSRWSTERAADAALRADFDVARVRQDLVKVVH